MDRFTDMCRIRKHTAVEEGDIRKWKDVLSILSEHDDAMMFESCENIKGAQRM